MRYWEENKTENTFYFFVKILIKDKRAVGVSFVRNNRKHSIMANKEVIVSAGTVSSPQILMLSGIGPKEHLKSKGVWLNRVKKNNVTHDHCRKLERTLDTYTPVLLSAILNAWYKKMKYSNKIENYHLLFRLTAPWTNL